MVHPEIKCGEFESISKVRVGYTGKSEEFECLSPSETHISKLICCLGDTTGSSFGFNLSNVFTSIHVYRQSNALYTCLAHVYMQTLRCTCTISLLNEHVDSTVHVHVMGRCHHWRSKNHWCTSDISIVHTQSFQWICGHSCTEQLLSLAPQYILYTLCIALWWVMYGMFN